MRIIILTSGRKGTASYCLPVLAEKTGAEIVRVIYCESKKQSKRKFYVQKLRKMLKIGLGGALNGIRMRKWFHITEVGGKPIEDIEVVCGRLNIPFSASPGINTEETRELMRAADADLGLSLGNSYISSRVFSIPRYGMLNIHGEELPAFQNAQSVIWQLYEGSSKTGYTIHQIDKKIDTGEIWKQETFPIVFKDSFGETVTASCAEILKRAAEGLADLLNHFETYRNGKWAQGKGNTYTTPSLRAYLRMNRNYKNFRKQTQSQ